MTNVGFQFQISSHMMYGNTTVKFCKLFDLKLIPSPTWISCSSSTIIKFLQVAQIEFLGKGSMTLEFLIIRKKTLKTKTVSHKQISFHLLIYYSFVAYEKALKKVKCKTSFI